MEGDYNVYAHSSLWMRPTGEWSINAKMVYIINIWLIHNTEESMLLNYKTFHFSPKMRQMRYPECKTTLNIYQILYVNSILSVICIICLLEPHKILVNNNVLMSHRILVNSDILLPHKILINNDILLYTHILHAHFQISLKLQHFGER